MSSFKLDKQRLKQLYQLRSDPSTRAQQQLLAIFGTKLIGEWLSQGGSCQAIYRTSECRAWSKDDIVVAQEALAWASGLESGPSCAALIPRPANPPAATRSWSLVLDGVQDPGNVGTLVRSAAAFDFDHLILIAPSCDPFNDKAIRASMGACLQQPLWQCTLEQFLQRCDPSRLLIADASPGAIEPSKLPELVEQGPLWLVIGSEGAGPRSQLLAQGRRIGLPMGQRVESLNAAVAGSILAYLIYSQRKLRR